MALIDANGLFDGDRFTLCTDEARLYWPYFWYASNAFGRLELNYHKVIARAFHRFRTPPSEPLFWNLIGQYQDAHLLFVYQDEGGIPWGQWDTPSKFLPKYQSNMDRRSPAPCEEALKAWKDEYGESKQQKQKGFGGPVKISEIFSKNSENVSGNFLHGIGVGTGVGVIGIGVEEKPFVQANARTVENLAAPEPPERKAGPEPEEEPDEEPEREPEGFLTPPPMNGRVKMMPKVDEVREWYEHEFYPLFPRHEAKKDGLEAARDRLKTPYLREKAMDAIRQQTAELLSRDKKHRPLPATWINGERWTDEDSPEPSRKAPAQQHLNGYRSPRDQAIIEGQNYRMLNQQGK